MPNFNLQARLQDVTTRAQGMRPNLIPQLQAALAQRGRGQLLAKIMPGQSGGQSTGPIMQALAYTPPNFGPTRSPINGVYRLDQGGPNRVQPFPNGFRPPT